MESFDEEHPVNPISWRELNFILKLCYVQLDSIIERPVFMRQHDEDIPDIERIRATVALLRQLGMVRQDNGVLTK